MPMELPSPGAGPFPGPVLSIATTVRRALIGLLQADSGARGVCPTFLGRANRSAGMH